MNRPEAIPCPGCGKPIPKSAHLDQPSGWLLPDAWCSSCGGSANRLGEPLVFGPRWYALVASEFDKISVMPLVLDPDTVLPLWDQAVPSAEATVMEPMEESPEAIEQEAAERVAMAIAILAYGVEFMKDAPPETLAEIEADRAKQVCPDCGSSNVTLYPLDEEGAHTLYCDECKREEPAFTLTAADRAHAAYWGDKTITNEEYGILMAEAHEEDQQREFAAEAEDYRREM